MAKYAKDTERYGLSSTQHPFQAHNGSWNILTDSPAKDIPLSDAPH